MGWSGRIGLMIAACAGAMSLSACVTTTAYAPSAGGEGYAYVPAPSQFTAFCNRNPAECHGQSAGLLQASAPIVYAPASRRRQPAQGVDRFDWSQAFAVPADRVSGPAVRYAPVSARNSDAVRHLADVSRQVNGTVQFRSDELAFGTPDFWSLPVMGQGGRLWGDCEDYALLKRSILLAEGYHPDALSMAVVRTQRGDVHAVLLVSTPEGEMVLDSLTPLVGTWKQSRYTLIARQAAGDSKAWIQPA